MKRTSTDLRVTRLPDTDDRIWPLTPLIPMADRTVITIDYTDDEPTNPGTLHRAARKLWIVPAGG